MNGEWLVRQGLNKLHVCVYEGIMHDGFLTFKLLHLTMRKTASSGIYPTPKKLNLTLSVQIPHRDNGQIPHSPGTSSDQMPEVFQGGS